MAATGDYYEITDCAGHLLSEDEVIALLRNHQQATDGQAGKFCVHEIGANSFVTWVANDLVRIATLTECVLSGAIRILGGSETIQ